MDIKIKINGMCDLLESALDDHKELSETTRGVVEAMGLRRYRRTFQIVTISLPRLSGHTAAAMQILDKYPCSLYITSAGMMVHLCRKDYREFVDRIYSVEEAAKWQTNNIQELRLLAKLKGGMDFLILDSVRIPSEVIDILFDIYQPRILAMLGDCEIIN